MLLVADVLPDQNVQVRPLAEMLDRRDGVTCLALLRREEAGQQLLSIGDQLRNRVFEPSGAHVIYSWWRGKRSLDNDESSRVFCSEFVAAVLRENFAGLALPCALPSCGDLYRQLVESGQYEVALRPVTSPHS